MRPYKHAASSGLRSTLSGQTGMCQFTQVAQLSKPPRAVARTPLKPLACWRHKDESKQSGAGRFRGKHDSRRGAESNQQREQQIRDLRGARQKAANNLKDQERNIHYIKKVKEIGNISLKYGTNIPIKRAEVTRQGINA